MNLRQCVTRKIKYSKVEVRTKDDTYNYLVYGITSVSKELKKYLKDGMDIDEIPHIVVQTITEKRAMTLDNFIKYSNIINNESEEN